MVKTTVFVTCDQLFGALIHLNFIILILICFLFMMPGVNYLIYGCSSARTTPRSITIPELNTGGKYCCSYYSRQGDREQFEKAN